MVEKHSTIHPRFSFSSVFQIAVLLGFYTDGPPLHWVRHFSGSYHCFQRAEEAADVSHLQAGVPPPPMAASDPQDTVPAAELDDNLRVTAAASGSNRVAGPSNAGCKRASCSDDTAMERSGQSKRSLVEDLRDNQLQEPEEHQIEHG